MDGRLRLIQRVEDHLPLLLNSLLRVNGLLEQVSLSFLVGPLQARCSEELLTRALHYECPTFTGNNLVHL